MSAYTQTKGTRSHTASWLCRVSGHIRTMHEHYAHVSPAKPKSASFQRISQNQSSILAMLSRGLGPFQARIEPILCVRYCAHWRRKKRIEQQYASSREAGFSLRAFQPEARRVTGAGQEYNRG